MIHTNFYLFIFVFSGGSYQESAISEIYRTWHNVNYVLSDGGNFTESPINKTVLPDEEFDPLGGHTVWQVTTV